MEQDTQTNNPLIASSIAVFFAGEPLCIEEMTIAQHLRLAALHESLKNLDLANLLPALLANEAAVVEALALMLGVDTARVLKAKGSELEAALAAVISLNKAFFLQLMALVQQAAALKVQLSLAELQAQQAYQTNNSLASGLTESPPLSNAVTANAPFTPTATANLPPTSPPLTAPSEPS